MAEFDAEVRNSLRQIHGSVTALAAAEKTAQKHAHDLGAELRHAFETGGRAAVAAKIATVDLSHQAHSAARSLRGLGGPIAQIAHHLTGGLGMGAGLGRLAMGMTLVGLAVESANRVMEANVERTKEMIEAQKELREVHERSRKELESQSGAGRSQLESHRKLLGAGGQGARDDADMVAGLGVASAEDAESGVARIYGLLGPGRRARAAVDVAMRVAKSGGGSFGAAAELAPKYGPLLDTTEGQFRASAYLRQHLTGSRGNPMETMDRALESINEDEALNTAGRIGPMDTAKRAIQRKRFAEQGEEDARADLARTIDPLNANLVELNRKFEENIDELRQQAEAQGSLAQAIANLATLFGGQGSLENQIRRKQNARAGAIGLPTGDAPGDLIQGGLDAASTAFGNGG